MELFFQDPSEIPLPAGEVRIRGLRAQPWPDGRKVRAFIELDPFQKRPSLELAITSPDGALAAEATVIESMTRKIELTMHLRRPPTPGAWQLSAVLYYSEPEGEDAPPKLVRTDQSQVSFELTDE